MPTMIPGREFATNLMSVALKKVQKTSKSAQMGLQYEGLRKDDGKTLDSPTISKAIDLC